MKDNTPTDKDWLYNLVRREVVKAQYGTIGELTDALVATIRKEIDRIVGQPRPYKEYEPCPRCGGQYQYKCSCHDAEEALIAEIRLRAGLEKK